MVSARDLITEARHLVDTARYAKRINRDQLGSASDYLGQALALLPPDAPVEEPPPVEEVPLPPAWPDPRELWAGGFTAATHWEGDARAADVYLPVGIGTWLGFPVPGEVRRMSSTGPMGTALVTALLYCTDGPWQGWLFGFTHVRDNVWTGYRPAGEPFMAYGNSGIEGLNTAQHIHFCADAPGGVDMSPDGKGDVSALGCLQALGFDLTVVPAIPSPNDYLSGRARAGRFL